MDFSPYRRKLERLTPLPVLGRVENAKGLVVESSGPPASIGDICEIFRDPAEEPIEAEVIGFQGTRLVSMPISATAGIRHGDSIAVVNRGLSVPVGPALLGRILDAGGRPIDDDGPLVATDHYPLHAESPNPLLRPEIDAQLETGVRAIDGLLPLGKGQRVGIFGGSGVGKSTLLGMLARHASADVKVIALVGERGREVREFIEKEIGPEGRQQCVLVVSTSDHPPLMRIRAALAATAIAEYFKDRGKDVLLVMDSVTRVAMAKREVGLAAGEPPSSKGYTPSVFSLLPKLFERTGRFEKGSITGIYTILVEGDDMADPIADAVRGLLDGHIVLSRDLAAANHFPAISILDSVSRLSTALMSDEQLATMSVIRDWLATYQKAEDLINIGAYTPGKNAKLDLAVDKKARIDDFLRQKPAESGDLNTTYTRLQKVTRE